MEVLCTACREYWPETPDFFHFDARGKRSAWCRACRSERRRGYYEKEVGHAAGPYRTGAHRTLPVDIEAESTLYVSLGAIREALSDAGQMAS
jgi:hypothetical protein